MALSRWQSGIGTNALRHNEAPLILEPFDKLHSQAEPDILMFFKR